jgi:threonine/homoserine/homoserine lactone efflux protein
MGEGFLWAPLALFAAVMTLTPGPNAVLVTASGANFGFRRTVRQMLGITFAFGCMAVAAGLGRDGSRRAACARDAQICGTAHFVYLAWRIARSGAGATGRAKPIGFLEAALFTWMNPKAWVSVLGDLAAWAGVGTAIGRLIAKPRARMAFTGRWPACCCSH